MRELPKSSAVRPDGVQIALPEVAVVDTLDERHRAWMTQLGVGHGELTRPATESNEGDTLLLEFRWEERRDRDRRERRSEQTRPPVLVVDERLAPKLPRWQAWPPTTPSLLASLKTSANSSARSAVSCAPSPAEPGSNRCSTRSSRPASGFARRSTACCTCSSTVFCTRWRTTRRASAANTIGTIRTRSTGRPRPAAPPSAVTPPPALP